MRVLRSLGENPSVDKGRREGGGKAREGVNRQEGGGRGEQEVGHPRAAILCAPRIPALRGSGPLPYSPSPARNCAGLRALHYVRKARWRILGAIHLGASRGHLGPSWAAKGASKATWRIQAAVLGKMAPAWGPRRSCAGTILEAPETVSGASVAVLVFFLLAGTSERQAWISVVVPMPLSGAI